MDSEPLAANRVSLGKVLAATDFSSISEKALHHAISVARRYRAKFYIVHVISSWGFNVAGYDSAVEASKLAYKDLEELVSRLAQSGALKDVDHEIAVPIGDFWEELRRFARAHEIDLIVLGTHGYAGMDKLVMGSVTETVFRYAARPVLTVGPCVPDTTSITSTRHHVVFPTDFSAASVVALPYAASIAKEHGARLTLLHVAEHQRSDSMLLGIDELDAVAERLRRLAEGLLASGHNVQVEPLCGSVVASIVDFTRKHDADLLVMGLKSPPEFFADRRPWLHAYAIVSEACCPVLTVRDARPDR
ncbi:MAG TPA: universal stress protein [Terriglobales bacterium]|nr:universal stress protein [Terriglobales bacterium]